MYSFGGNHVNIPRKAMVMPLDTFMADFEGSELYLEDIEKESGTLEFVSKYNNIIYNNFNKLLIIYNGILPDIAYHSINRSYGIWIVI